MFKRIKRLLRKRRNAGFTLVEMIVASALLGILMLGMFGFVQPVLRSVKAKEQNARAVMLAETVESYIANSTKYAYFIQTFSGVTENDLVLAGGEGLPPIATAKYAKDPAIDSITDENLKNEALRLDAVCTEAAGTLEDMLNCLNNIVGTENYEIRCIGMRWLSDSKSGDMKMMLTNEVVDQKTCALDPTKTKLVFETCFYDGLYPVLKIGNYTNQYQVLGGDGTAVNKFADDELEIAAGLELTMDVYLDASCYSTTGTTRSNANQTFTGTSFIDFRNISSINTINTAKEYKIRPNAQVHSYSDALAVSGGAVYNDPKVGNTYYTDSFIYYIARKTKTTGGAGGGSLVTSTPPESSDSSEPSESSEPPEST